MVHKPGPVECGQQSGFCPVIFQNIVFNRGVALEVKAHDLLGQLAVCIQFGGSQCFEGAGIGLGGCGKRNPFNGCIAPVNGVPHNGFYPPQVNAGRDLGNILGLVINNIGVFYAFDARRCFGINTMVHRHQILNPFSGPHL